MFASSRITCVPLVVVLVMACCIEYECDFLAHVPLLRRSLSEPIGNLKTTRPSTVGAAGIRQYAYDEPVRRSEEEGGLGYRGV